MITSRLLVLGAYILARLLEITTGAIERKREEEEEE